MRAAEPAVAPEEKTETFEVHLCHDRSSGLSAKVYSRGTPFLAFPKNPVKLTQMSAVKKLNLISVEDYLNGELICPVKHEYLAGLVYAMAGGQSRS